MTIEVYFVGTKVTLPLSPGVCEVVSIFYHFIPMVFIFCINHWKHWVCAPKYHFVRNIHMLFIIYFIRYFIKKTVKKKYKVGAFFDFSICTRFRTTFPPATFWLCFFAPKNVYSLLEMTSTSFVIPFASFFQKSLAVPSLLTCPTFCPIIRPVVRSFIPIRPFRWIPRLWW